MPTNTFFRLPPEKRDRLLEAAWDEFTQFSFSDASINRIIHQAHIPRGSFYQYFQDKDDLLQYLLGEIRSYFMGVFGAILTQSQGDLFSFPPLVFDRFLDQDGDTDPILRRCIRIVSLNPGFDLQQLLFQGKQLMTPQLLELVDTGGLRRGDPEYVNHVAMLLLACLAYAVADTLKAPRQRTLQRALLLERVQIIRWGSLLPPEEPRPADKEEHYAQP